MFLCKCKHFICCWFSVHNYINNDKILTDRNCCRQNDTQNEKKKKEIKTSLNFKKMIRMDTSKNKMAKQTTWICFRKCLFKTKKK